MFFAKNITKNLQVINIIINFAAEFITHKEEQWIMAIMENQKSILRKLREKFSYTQGEVSKYLGISQPAYQKYETGETEVSMEGLAKLARLYSIDEYDILSGNIQRAELAFAFRKNGEANLEDVAHFQQIVTNYIMMCDELEKDR